MYGDGGGSRSLWVQKLTGILHADVSPSLFTVLHDPLSGSAVREISANDLCAVLRPEYTSRLVYTPVSEASNLKLLQLVSQVTCGIILYT